jgi:hypothetical protein
MEFTNDLWVHAVYGLLLALAALKQYLDKPKQPPKNEAIIAGVGLGFGERDQMERLIAEVKRIADALTDKNTSGINHRLDELLERIDEAERRGHTQKPRQPR